MRLLDENGLTEEEFLAMYAKKNYPRPYLTADIVLLSEDESRVLLIRRRGHPFIGKWALPGGFSKQSEALEETAIREMREETGIAKIKPEDVREIGVFSKPGRDPRGWVVTGAYMAKVDPVEMKPAAGDDAVQAVWCEILHDHDGTMKLKTVNGELFLNELAFDHGDILAAALKQ